MVPRQILKVAEPVIFIRFGSNEPSSMPTVERSIEIAATPQTIWSVLGDPSLVPKIFPNVISVKTDPPGMAHVGQKNTLLVHVGGRRSQAIIETTEVVPDKKLSVRQTSGGMLKKYDSTTTLTPLKKGTKLTTTVDYEVAAGFLGRILSATLVNRTVRNNILTSAKNLKELAELKEMPSKG
jgi:carbon monoxide dehydrogenase subunit G